MKTTKQILGLIDSSQPRLALVLVTCNRSTRTAHIGSHDTGNYQPIQTDAKAVFTLQRMKDIYSKVSKLMSIQPDAIQVHDMQFYNRETKREITDTEFKNGDYDEGGYITTYKKYFYYPIENLFRIYIDGMPVYENNDGDICSDADALADCLM